jgi:hypothetical protein
MKHKLHHRNWNCNKNEIDNVIQQYKSRTAVSARICPHQKRKLNKIKMKTKHGVLHNLKDSMKAKDPKTLSSNICSSCCYCIVVAVVVATAVVAAAVMR